MEGEALLADLAVRWRPLASGYRYILSGGLGRLRAAGQGIHAVAGH